MLEAVFENLAVKHMLEQLEKAADDVIDQHPKYVALLSAVVFSDVMDHFKKEEGEDGKWTPWSSVYAAHMKRIGKSGNKLLQFSGKMRNSFQPTQYRPSSAGILWYNNAKTSSGFPYAAAHNEGGKKLPQRQFMWLSDKGMERIVDNTLAYLLERI